MPLHVNGENCYKADNGQQCEAFRNTVPLFVQAENSLIDTQTHEAYDEL